MDTIAQYLDLANHHANATSGDIKKLCADVLTYQLHAAFVNPTLITVAREALGAEGIVGTVISFPLGQETLAIKKAAANEAVMLGANELDVVPNLALFLAGDTGGFLKEMTAIVDAARMTGKPVIVKFILEIGYFDKLPDGKEKLKEAALLVKQSGADFIKLGSGMGPRDVTVEDLKIVKDAVGDTIKIKVAGGITTRPQAEAFIKGGASRIGTSHAVEIVKGQEKQPSPGE